MVAEVVVWRARKRGSRAGAAKSARPGLIGSLARSVGLLSGASLLLCGTASVRCQGPADEFPQVRLPEVLLIGDSISIGYTAALTETLAGSARVVRPLNEDGTPENAAGTRNGLQRLSQWLKAFPTADLIVFNFGLHDMKWEPVENGSAEGGGDAAVRVRQTSPDQYRTALEQLADSLLATGAKLLFVATTPVPTGTNSPLRRPGDPLIYNGLAQQVMASRGIEVLDLWTLASEQPQWQRPRNVHFTDEGYRSLGEAVAKAVRASLADPIGSRLTQQAATTGTAWEAAPADVQRAGRDGRFNYLETSVPAYTLPDPLAVGGRSVTESQQWAEHREATLELFRDHVYGQRPEAAEQARLNYRFDLEHRADGVVGQRWEASWDLEQASFRFPLLFYRPDQEPPSERGWPAIVLIHNREFPDLQGLLERPSPFAPIAAIVERGYAVAIFHTSDVDPDRADGYEVGVRGFCNRWFDNRPAEAAQADPQRWGALSAWAWAASRVLDFLEQQPVIDAGRVAVIGHSRGGKTAAWAAANDTRFAAALINQSGCGGAALSRRRYGETVQRITQVFPHWFAPRLNDFAERESELPVDQHQLIGLIAPRAVAIGSASQDLWADPRGEYLSLVGASPIYRLLGFSSIDQPAMPPLGQLRRVGPTSYSVRPGPHNLHAGDWTYYLDFLDSQIP
jgi:lysophospholipase L1-like esterase